MNTKSPLQSRQRGALMGATLLLLLVGGLFLSAWVSLMSTRAVQVSWLETAVQRRLCLENSRLLAWQSAMEHGCLPSHDMGSLTAGILGSNSGGILPVKGWNGVDALASMLAPGTMANVFPYNNTGLRPGPAFLAHATQIRPSALASGLDSFTSHLFLKSRPPVLSGDLFIVYRKPDSAVTEIDVHKTTGPHHAYWQAMGRTVIRHPPSLFARNTSRVDLPFQSRSLYLQEHDPYNNTPVTGLSIGGGRIMPSNFPVVPSTVGTEREPPKDIFDGHLNVIRNDLNPSNSLHHIINREVTAGRAGVDEIDVYIKSEDTSLPWWMEEYTGIGGNRPPHPPPGYPSGYPTQFKTLYVRLDHPGLRHLRIRNVIHQIVFVGQSTSGSFETAGSLSPVIVTLLQDEGQPVGNITFQNENNRRLILGCRHPHGQKLDLSWTGSPVTGSNLRWRLVFINEHQAVWLDLHKSPLINIQWIGGVMTNWFFKRYNSTGPRADRLVFLADDAVPTLPHSGPPYSTLLPRDLWLEQYFLPTPPSS